MTGTDRQAVKAIWIPAPGKALDDKPDVVYRCQWRYAPIN